MSSRPVKSWAKGVEDYLKHIAEIKSEFKDVLEAHTNGVAPAPAPAAPSLFGGATTTTAAPASSPAPLFGTFTAPAGPAATSSLAFPEAANNPFTLKPSSTPLFGAASTPAAGSAPSPAFGGFGGGFGATHSPLTIPPSTPEGNEDEDEEQRPPSPSFKEKERDENDTEECLMKCKVKFFTKKEATDPWGDHGVNHLELLREKVASDGKTKKARIVCRNSIGKAVLNAGLYKGMSKPLVTEKKKPDGSMAKNGVILPLYNAAEEMVKKITMFRLGKPDDVEKLNRLITESVATL